MDAPMAREQLRELNEALKKVDEEREVLLSLVRGYEGWLRLHGNKGDTATAPLPVPAPRAKAKRSTATLGTISLRKAVLQVIREAHGSPVHIKEISARAQALGATTTAKDPFRIVDLVAYNLKTRSDQPLERVSPRSWRWTGE